MIGGHRPQPTGAALMTGRGAPAVRGPLPGARRGNGAMAPECSLRINLESGTWKDFESDEGGGVRALVCRELSTWIAQKRWNG